ARVVAQTTERKKGGVPCCRCVFDRCICNENTPNKYTPANEIKDTPMCMAKMAGGSGQRTVAAPSPASRKRKKTAIKASQPVSLRLRSNRKAQIAKAITKKVPKAV